VVKTIALISLFLVLVLWVEPYSLKSAFNSPESSIKPLTADAVKGFPQAREGSCEKSRNCEASLANVG